MLKNFKDKAISNKPNTTFTEFNDPPDSGKELSQLAKTPNSMNGKASAIEKPNMITVGPIIDPEDKACTSDEPIIGPVQEKETKTNVNAIKKTPTKPPLSAFLSALFTHLLGICISKAPKNEKAKIMKMAKNIRFKVALVDIS